GGQIERGGHPVERVRPVVELLLQEFPLKPGTLPFGKVAVLNIPWFQLHGIAAYCSAVKGAELAVQDELRPAIEDKMMKDEVQHVVAFAEPHQVSPEEGALGEIEWRLCCVVDELLCRPFSLLVLHVCQIHDYDGDRAYGLDDLHGPTVLDG